MISYSYLDKILHRQFLGNGEISRFCINKIIKNSTNIKLQNLENIFITGLARSGSTILLQSIEKSNLFGSLRYKYMPFILTPKIANIFSKLQTSNLNLEIDRLHNDGLKISLNSPECLDEPFWINTLYKNNEFSNSLTPHNVDLRHAKAYGYLLNQFSKLEKKNLVIKNNNNHLRLPSLAKFYPNCKFLVLFRLPIAQSYSLLNLHKNFIYLQQENPFNLEYMNMLGHWEVGKSLKPYLYSPNQKNIIKKHQNNQLKYWLNQWIFTYEWLLEKLPKNLNNIKFVCYEELCNNVEYKEQLYEFLEIKENKKLEFKKGKSNNYNFSSYSTSKEFKKSMQIYQKLKEKI